MAMRPSTRARTTALVAACAGVTVFGVAVSTGSVLASASPAATHHVAATHRTAAKTAVKPVVVGSRYLALGDSVSFGYREPNAIPITKNNYKKVKTFVGFPEDVADNLGLKVANLACPGETTTSFIDPSKPSNGCENHYDATTGKQVNGGYRTAYKLHTSYHGAQLAYGVKYLKAHKNVRLVSLMIGANDGFLCLSNPKCQLLNAVAKIGKNVGTILKTIRTKAHYTGQIVLVNYYSTNYADPTATGESNLLNSTLETAAKPYHVTIANAFASFKKAAAQAHGDTCTAQLLTQLKTTPATCGVHPSVAGQALLAQTIEQAIKK
jgi:lysophospholipase L1-like esterase